ncbi:MAG: outer membrane lipid asymmetry maintenance protein MlaD [Gammaproteobacteria bacterium]|nr:outer membrane lipid asymmetry maintenance protein MlaD [Gammaproteobacteria bacterium]
MDRSRTIEIGVGLFVAAGLAALFMLAMQVSNLSAMSDNEGYDLTARFENVGGLKVRSPVSVGGVRVGRVAAIDFDSETFEAVVRMHIAKQYDKFPTDTSARIFTAGLLGEQYVALEPGGAEEVLKTGDQIQLTQSALVLEQIIGQFLFSKASEGATQSEGTKQ